jgi:hypothetical protein
MCAEHSVCTTSVCLGSVKLYSSVQLCTQKYSPSVQDVYSSTVYLYMNLYIKCNMWTDVGLSGVRKGNLEFF